MRKAFVLLMFIFVCLVSIGFVTAVRCGPAGQCTYSNLDLNGLYLGFNGWSGQVSCGSSSAGYDSTNVLNANSCGGNQKIANSFGSVAATPGGSWGCIVNNICNSGSNAAFNNIFVAHTVSTGTASYPSCPSGYTRFDDNIMYTGLVRQSYVAICIKNEYFEYFKGEFRFAATGGGAWDPGDGSSNCDPKIYDADPSCPSGYKVLSRNFVADSAGCGHGMVIRAAMCVRDSAPSGIIDLDYNEAKCKTILGNSAWIKDTYTGIVREHYCCGDEDSETSLDSCTGSVTSVCSGSPFFGAVFPGITSMPNLFAILNGLDFCCGDDSLNGDFEN